MKILILPYHNIHISGILRKILTILMSEGGQNFESFAGAQPGAEKAQETQEQFQERYRQAQATIKQIKKEESKKKKQDDSLAKVIVQFLGEENRTAYFLIISRLVAINIPSDFILSLLALIYKPAAEAIDHYIPESNTPSSSDAQQKSTALFSPKEKEKIDFWMQGIMIITEAEKKRLFQTALTPKNKINEGVIRLFVFVLREYLEQTQHENIVLENLESFATAFFDKIAQIIINARHDIHFLEGDEKR